MESEQLEIKKLQETIKSRNKRFILGIALLMIGVAMLFNEFTKQASFVFMGFGLGMAGANA